MNTKLVRKIKELPRTPGVYIFRDQNRKIIYVGKAVNLKNRASSYFRGNDRDPKTEELVKNIENIEWIECGSEFEALILEADLIKRYKPKYNIRFRDDKNYAYLKITKEDYPRISIIHQPQEEEADYLGPFTDTGAVRTILKIARKIFPFCTCNVPLDRVCLYYHLGECPGHGPKYISSKDYQGNIMGIKKIFSGKAKGLKNDFQREMKLASKEKRYEEAARARDNLKYLLRIEKSHLISERDLAVDKGLSELARALSLPSVPKRIECFDISNVMGTAATGSMVVFEGGIARPRDFRRFRVETVKGANDFASLAEILGRRFKLAGIKRKDESFSALPNLVILDGGKGQLSAVKKIVNIPKGVEVVALAKKREILYILKGKEFIEVRLPDNSEAKYLIQRIRDEAHRFAITYHRKVKSRELFETSLDGIIGIGPKTKKKLLEKFGSIDLIKKAKDKELVTVVGEKVAKRLKENL